MLQIDTFRKLLKPRLVAQLLHKYTERSIFTNITVVVSTDLILYVNIFKNKLKEIIIKMVVFPRKCDYIIMYKCHK